MPQNWRSPASLLTILTLFLTTVAWVMFAPTQVGGQATYVIVNGNSMEPNFHLGDLAIVRQAQQYQIGDIVTYRNAQLREYVIHRIVGEQAGHFLIKGDHNDWIDTYHPVQAEIVGKLWIHIPGAGKFIQWLRIPLNLAIVVGLLGGIFMAGSFTQTPQDTRAPTKRPSGGSALEGGLLALGFLGLVFLALGVYAFLTPLSRTGGSVPYQQVGVFFYSAAGTPGVYDTDMVHSGEPIFPKLTCAMNLGFSYTLAGDQLQDIAGAQQLVAQVSDDQSGWQRTIPLTTTTAFNGSSYTALATLDLCQIETLVTTVEQETGFYPSFYTLAVIPHVSVMGQVDGQTLQDSFDPELIFKFDKLHFFLATDGTQSDPLRTAQSGILTSGTPVENSLPLLDFQLPVWEARIVAIGGLSLTLVAALILGLIVYTVTRDSQEAAIRMRYGALLVNVYERGLESLASVIDVTSIDDLARLAERHGAMILHMTRNSLHYYFVQHDGVTYRFIIREGRARATKTEPARNYESF